MRRVVLRLLVRLIEAVLAANALGSTAAATVPEELAVALAAMPCAVVAWSAAMRSVVAWSAVPRSAVACSMAPRA